MDKSFHNVQLALSQTQLILQNLGQIFFFLHNLYQENETKLFNILPCEESVSFIFNAKKNMSYSTCSFFMLLSVIYWISQMYYKVNDWTCCVKMLPNNQGHYLNHTDPSTIPEASAQWGDAALLPPSLVQSSRYRELGLIWCTLAPRPYRRRRPRPIIAGPASPPDYRVGCDTARHVSRPLLPRGSCRRQRLQALQWVSI